MIGWNMVSYGGASPSWSRIGVRNPVRESTPAQTLGTVSPDSAANGTEAVPVGTVAPLPAESDLNRSDEAVVRMEIEYPGERPAFPFADVEQAAKPNTITGVKKSETPAQVSGRLRRPRSFLQDPDEDEPGTGRGRRARTRTGTRCPGTGQGGTGEPESRQPVRDDSHGHLSGVRAGVRIGRRNANRYRRRQSRGGKRAFRAGDV